ncbi:DUF1636 domain-containing protein [Saccharopolyspora sp. K220]|uniref:DUF1636 family protein n=1 Tax=Saccharopolyspora soli TaxID=2926618 RepID=UPI001F562172|nr:DUF1636 family protein [Saccharopolyspora soli]MCI2422326.1 DUF1636 domain-containing protein [Saccharopolyspora soli]
MPLLICRTCPRYDPHTSGEFGHRLNAAITANANEVTVHVRKVACLGGCPDHGVVAVDGPGKARVRFSGLTEHDAEAIIRAATAHDTCATGIPQDWEVPDELAGRISSITLKRRS